MQEKALYLGRLGPNSGLHGGSSLLTQGQHWLVLPCAALVQLNACKIQDYLRKEFKRLMSNST